MALQALPDSTPWPSFDALARQREELTAQRDAAHRALEEVAAELQSAIQADREAAGAAIRAGRKPPAETAVLAAEERERARPGVITKLSSPPSRESREKSARSWRNIAMSGS